MSFRIRSPRAALQLLGLATFGASLGFFSSILNAEDWNRFRGANGSGVSVDKAALPTAWGPTENLAWKTKLPGPGSSSPIVVGDKIFVTCWSGYGTEEPNGTQEKLKRHLVCVDRGSGKIIWDESVSAALPEDEYGGMFAEHGYASHTPASDGENVYAFFGKSGVYAYSLDGKQLWKADVGSGLDPRAWGSACSPILYKDKVIVLAAAESATLFAFEKRTGKVAWQEKADSFTGTWGTPVLVETKTGTEVVVGVPSEIWGFNADTGKFKWFCTANDSDSFCSSVVQNGDSVIAIEGRSGGSIAVRAGGKDDVTNSQVVWKGNDRNRIGTPVIMDGKVYFFAGRVMTCLDAASGKELYQGRLPAAPGADAAAAPAGGAGGRGQGGGGGGRGQGGVGGRRGGGGGGMGDQDYGSPVAGDGKIYFVTRNGDMHVIKAGDKFEHLAVNRVTSDTEDFSSTPAIAGSQLLVRSSKYLYCIEGK